MIYSSVIDACVIYPASIRDVLLSVAAEGVFKPYWSQMIHSEWKRNLLKNRSDLNQAKLDKTSLAMDQFFHGANQNDFQHLIDKLILPDINDRHVLALAIKTQSKYIVTKNLKDFPVSVLEQYNICAIDPDDFLIQLNKNFKMFLLEAMKKQRARLKNPPLTVDEFIDSIENSGLVKFANYLKNERKEI